MERLEHETRIGLRSAAEGVGDVALLHPDECPCGLVDVGEVADAPGGLLLADVAGGGIDELLDERAVGVLDLLVGAGGVGEGAEDGP
ncbi:MAG TPA: hypothetical protein VD931_14855 [Baekduia sp.]|nr:hypothetical protein [Baekduia sp.]